MGEGVRVFLSSFAEGLRYHFLATLRPIKESREVGRVSNPIFPPRRSLTFFASFYSPAIGQ